MKQPNAFTLGFCTVTGATRERSYLIEALSPKTNNDVGMSAKDRNRKVIAFTKGSHLQIGKVADSNKRAAMRMARI